MNIDAAKYDDAMKRAKAADAAGNHDVAVRIMREFWKPIKSAEAAEARQRLESAKKAGQYRREAYAKRAAADEREGKFKDAMIKLADAGGNHAVAAIPPTPKTLELTQVLYYAIMEKLAVYDAKVSAHPWHSEYFRAFMIEKLSTREMKMKPWNERTMRLRKKTIENVIAESYGIQRINLRKYRDSVDPRTFSAAEEQMDAVRKRRSKARF